MRVAGAAVVKQRLARAAVVGAAWCYGASSSIVGAAIVSAVSSRLGRYATTAAYTVVRKPIGFFIIKWLLFFI